MKGHKLTKAFGSPDGRLGNVLASDLLCQSLLETQVMYLAEDS